MDNKIVQSEQHLTYRDTVPELESLLYVAHPVLDHGFVRVIDYMGGDKAIVQAARVSYGNGTKSTSDDRALLRYMYRHRHHSPFEMCEIKLHVKLPIFVARQWIRHRTASVNELSARYSILDREFYIPNFDDTAKQSAVNKQGRGESLDIESYNRVRGLLIADALDAYSDYEDMLQSGLARELARMNLSLNYYTQWYWKTDLRNLFNFLSLRCDAHAQLEIRKYANVILDIVKKWVPLSTEAFVDYDPNQTARLLSGHEIAFLQRMVKGECISFEEMRESLSERECDAFASLFPSCDRDEFGYILPS